MVIIKTTCPSCGEVDLTAEKVELRIALGGTGSSYAFDCPRCTDRVRKPADSRVVQLLISGGVAPQILAEKAEASVERGANVAPRPRSAGGPVGDLALHRPRALRQREALRHPLRRLGAGAVRRRGGACLLDAARGVALPHRLLGEQHPASAAGLG